MSDNGNDGKKRNHSKPLVEHPEMSVDISGSMESSSGGEPSTAEKQVLGANSTVEVQVKGTSNQTESTCTTVHALRAKWEEHGKKTYAEMASVLPGGAERYIYQMHVHSGEHPQVYTIQEQQSSDQYLQGVVKNPLQENPNQGSQSMQGSSNQDCLYQGSSTPAPAQYESKDQHLQGSLVDGSGVHGHSEENCVPGASQCLNHQVQQLWNNQPAAVSQEAQENFSKGGQPDFSKESPSSRSGSEGPGSYRMTSASKPANQVHNRNIK